MLVFSSGLRQNKLTAPYDDGRQEIGLFPLTTPLLFKQKSILILEFN